MAIPGGSVFFLKIIYHSFPLIVGAAGTWKAVRGPRTPHSATIFVAQMIFDCIVTGSSIHSKQACVCMYTYLALHSE